MSFKIDGVRRAGLISGLAVVASFALWAGCSPTTNSALGGPEGNGGSGNGTGAGGSGSTVGTGAYGNVGNGGEWVGLGGGINSGTGSTNSADAACGATTLIAEKVVESHIETHTETVTHVTPAALYIMQDQSGSMVPLWGFATQAITDFVSDPMSDGLYVAMQFFPFVIPISNCSETTFATPEVPWGILGPPGTQNQAIITALGQHAPFGLGTPIEDALRGVIKGCKDFEIANPGIECYGLLITDGEPSDCSAKTSGVYQQIATEGAAAGAPVYTVGMPGADFAFLDTIATGAGTDCNGSAAGLTCNAANGAEFVAALNAVRETVTEVITTEEVVEEVVSQPLDCEWVVPSGEDQDFNKMTVKFTDQTSGIATELARVLDPADCDAAGVPAWHYDNEDAPTKLVACPGTCDTIKAADAKIDILVGCDVEIIVPR
jgi:hypothetical protein